MFKKLIGDRRFYKSILAIAVPVMIQNGITNFVNLLDNVMVGRIGTEAMSAVSIVNNLIFVFNLLIFGAVSASGIYTAQYHGSRDMEGVRYTFRFKLYSVLAACILGVSIFVVFKEPLISLYLHESDSTGDLALAMKLAKDYLGVMLAGLLPFALSQVYASTLRETKNTVLPMLTSIVAVLVNFVFNYILIFGKLGAPALGVKGAALATVMSRFVELFLLVIITHLRSGKYTFAKGVYRSPRVPTALVKQITVKGIPLIANEVMWAGGLAVMSYCYSLRGIDVVAALNISSTVNNLFNVVYIALGSSIGIIVGALLGAGKIEEAIDTDRKIIAFSVMCSTGMGLLLASVSGIIPLMYNTTLEVRGLATFMIVTVACLMPFGAFFHASYFTLRSGGKVLITMLLDSFYMWIVVVPFSLILSKFTDLNIFLLYPLCQGLDVIKAVFGFYLLKKSKWANKLVSE